MDSETPTVSSQEERVDSSTAMEVERDPETALGATEASVLLSSNTSLPAQQPSHQEAEGESKDHGGVATDHYLNTNHAANSNGNHETNYTADKAATAMSVQQPGESPRKPSKRKGKKRKASATETSGRWTPHEHEAFLRGLATYGREWKRVAQHIPTRTSAQVRSHAQKYFSRAMTMQQQQQTQPGTIAHEGGLLQNSHNSSDDSSLQIHVNRILAQPQAVAQEVHDTLAALRQRYRDLQQRLAAQQPQNPLPPPLHSNSNSPMLQSTTSTNSLDSLQNEEWIALNVLHGKMVPHQSTREFQQEVNHQYHTTTTTNTSNDPPQEETTTAAEHKDEPPDEDTQPEPSQQPRTH